MIILVFQPDWRSNFFFDKKVITDPDLSGEIMNTLKNYSANKKSRLRQSVTHYASKPKQNNIPSFFTHGILFLTLSFTLVRQIT